MSAYFWCYLFKQIVWYAICNQSSSEFMVYAGNMNLFDLAGITSVQILIYVYRNIL